MSGEFFLDSTDRDKDRLREVRALDRMYEGRALRRRHRDRWLRTLAYWAGAWWTLVAIVLWTLAVYIGGS